MEISASVEKQSDELNLEGEKEAEAIQVEEGGVQPRRTKGMQLGYIAPTIKQGIPTASLTKSELEIEAAKWKFSVILYVIGDTPTITMLNNFLQKQCLIMGQIEIFYHMEGYFVVRFENAIGKDKMLYEGPFSIANRPIIVKEWVADFRFEEEVLREIPLWIRLPKLPLNCWSGDSLRSIGSVIGKPICADECTTQQNRISYARMLVEIDITQPLVYKIQIEGDEGKMVEQQMFYEWAPMFCQKCQRVGHICRENKKEGNIMPQPQKQWQPKVQPKEKGVEKQAMRTENVEVWCKPKNASPSVIQIGHIPIPTGNIFTGLEEPDNASELVDKGGDLIPSSLR